MLSRLAIDSGGRVTRHTNDLSLGYARAQRDLGCSYTIGLYVAAADESVLDGLRVRVLRPGLRALHPSSYLFRSPESRRENEIAAAFHMPELFDAGFVRAHVFLLQPRGAKAWDALVAVSFPVRFDGPARTVSLDFGAVVSDESAAVHDFHRRVSLRAREGADPGERRFLFLEPAVLRAGRHEVTVVMRDPEGATAPAATRIALEVPRVGKRELTLVRPILGRVKDTSVVVRGNVDGELDSDAAAAFDIVASRGSFEPLLVQLADGAAALRARTKACRVGSGEGQDGDGTLRRAIEGEGGRSVELPPLPLELEKDGKVSCQSVYEILPEDAKRPGRYVFEALVSSPQEPGLAREELPYAVREGAPRDP